MNTITIIGYTGIHGSFFSTNVQDDPFAIGDVLLHHYNSEDLAISLIEMGTSALIAKNLVPNPAYPHTITDPQEGVCQFFDRDGGLEICRVYADYELPEIVDGFDAYYYYKFQNNKWELSIYENGTQGPFKPINRPTLRIVSVNGYPVAHISHIPLSFRIYRNKRRTVKAVNEDTVAVDVDYWYDFVDLNKDIFGLTSVSDIVVDRRSVSYYGFQDGWDAFTFRTRLTKKFVSDFFNKDCSRIVRYEPNISGGTNFLGMHLAEFQTVILDCGSTITVDEDATLEECHAILEVCHPNSTVARVLSAHAKVLEMSVAEKQRIIDDVNFYESEISSIFKKYEKEIEEFKNALPTPAFDCGFTTVMTTDVEMQKKYQQLISMGLRADCSVNVSFPGDYNACSKSYKILEELRRLSNKDILHTIRVQTIYD